MEAMKALVLTIILLNLANLADSQLKSFFFNLVSYLQDSLQYKQYLVPFIAQRKHFKNFIK